ncbi:MAG: dienelactone hydrolase family protein [Gammaproteobacteria bacterium]|nr:dienelactone hydrolase family protein [Gammaproteobacteria bacterium]
MTSQAVLNFDTRFRDQPVTFANGVEGQNIEIPSASPINYHQVIREPDEIQETTVDGKLFLPIDGKPPFPLVIVAPGSLGVAPSHIQHAETINRLGVATFILDSFGARQVTSTVADQTQFSFAASAYDLLAAFEALSHMEEIDSVRIGAQGHSRGGSAVITASMRCFVDPVIGSEKGFAGVLAAYPWSGHQFLDPRVGRTEVRVLMGDADEWCSVAQVQGHCQAIRLVGGAATMRIFQGAQHSFDRDTPIVDIEDAAVARDAPISYIANDGALIHPVVGVPDPTLVDRDTMVYSMKAGYGKKGARIGSAEGQASTFRNDMIQFWTRILNLQVF